MFAGPVGASSDRRASTMLWEESLSLRLEREGCQGFTRLFERPSHFLFARKEGLYCRAPSRASPSRWVSAKLQEEPPSLSHGARERSEVPLAFGSPLAREGLSAEAPSGASLGRGVSASFAEGAP